MVHDDDNDDINDDINDNEDLNYDFLEREKEIKRERER